MAAKHSYKLHHVSVYIQRACAMRYRVQPMPNCVDIVKLRAAVERVGLLQSSLTINLSLGAVLGVTTTDVVS